jgi:hypothetical protein
VTRDVRQVADALLYEGYLLYPYRPTALKNRHRYPFGTLYPEPFCRAQQAGDAFSAEIQCLVLGPPEAQLSVELRFLHPEGREAVVREARLPQRPLAELAATPARSRFDFPPLAGELFAEVSPAGAARWKIHVQVRNQTLMPEAESCTRDDALCRSLASAHLVLASAGGEFVSLIDPPDDLRELAGSCRQVGLWPVLAGQPPGRDLLLAAPIILYDYPELAPESPGDFFDGTEIDELLTLRVLTLTDDEKREMSDADARARDLLARTESSGLAKLAQLHGRLRSEPAIRKGASVRLRPRGRGDIFDLALAGQIATVESVERDLEGQIHVAVTVDADPGKDLGAYGHRFFFRPEEMELL